MKRGALSAVKTGIRLWDFRGRTRNRRSFHCGDSHKCIVATVWMPMLPMLYPRISSEPRKQHAIPLLCYIFIPKIDPSNGVKSEE